MNQNHLQQSKRRQSSSSIEHLSKLPRISSLPRRAYSLTQGKRNLPRHLEYTRCTSLSTWSPSFTSCEPSCVISTTGEQDLGDIPPDHSAQVLPYLCTPHIEGLENSTHEVFCETRTACELDRLKPNLIQDLSVSEIIPRAKRLISLPTARCLSTALVGGCSRPLSFRTSSASQRKTATIPSRRTPSWKVRRWRTSPHAGILTGIHDPLRVRRSSVFDPESRREGFELEIMEECNEPHKIQQRDPLEESSSINGDDGQRTSEHEAEIHTSLEPSESSLSSLSSAESEESHSERSLPVVKIRKLEPEVTRDPHSGSPMAECDLGPRRPYVGQSPTSPLSHSLASTTESVAHSSSRKRDVSDVESEADVQGHRQTQNLVDLQGRKSKALSTIRHVPKSSPAAFKSPMINSTKPKAKTVAKNPVGRRSFFTSHDEDKASQDPSKLKGILLTKKVVELEQTLTLMMDAERILKTGDIQSVIDAQKKWQLVGRSAAEYLFKVSDAAHSSTRTERSAGYEIPTTTHWGDTWGFMAPFSDTAEKINEQKKLEMSQRGYVSDHADDDLPDEDSLLPENSVRKYDCSGAVIDSKNKSVKNTSKLMIGESSGASTSNCAPRASTLGEMMQGMGIEPSALGWDSEEEDWKD